MLKVIVCLLAWNVFQQWQIQMNMLEILRRGEWMSEADRTMEELLDNEIRVRIDDRWRKKDAIEMLKKLQELNPELNVPEIQ